MFLAINQNVHNAKKRKKQKHKTDTTNIIKPTGVTETASLTATATAAATASASAIDGNADTDTDTGTDRDTDRERVRMYREQKREANVDADVAPMSVTMRSPQKLLYTKETAALMMTTTTTTTTPTADSRTLAATSTVNLLDNILFEYAPTTTTPTPIPTPIPTPTPTPRPTPMKTTKTTTTMATSNACELMSAKCKYCQHELTAMPSNAQQKRKQELHKHVNHQHWDGQPHEQPTKLIALPDRVPCHCACNCIQKYFDNGNATINATNAANATNATNAYTTPHGGKAAASLCTVYACLGTLALALATLSVLFYTHVSAVQAPLHLPSETLPPTMPTTPTTTTTTTLPTLTNFAFREQFRRELVASEHVLRAIVAQILQQQADEKLQQQPEQQQQQQQQQWQQLSDQMQDSRYRAVNSSVQQQQQEKEKEEQNVRITTRSAAAAAAATTTTSRAAAHLPPGSAATATIIEQQQQQQQQQQGGERGKVDGGGAGGARVEEAEGTLRTGVEESDKAGEAQETNYDYDKNEAIMATVKNIRKFNGNAAAAATDRHEIAGNGKRTRRDIASSPSSMHADQVVEFFHPSHRKVLDEQDLEIRKRTGQKGAAPGGDDWIYLNTYCRVPEKMITGFCKSTQDYCPPAPQGPPGLPGIPGPKGNRGDVGLPGPSGLDGMQGPVGPRGAKGDLGIPGRAGLDGRDGVPGEPGLDGVPGRAGSDGVPGKNGLPGLDGKDGLNGKDGKDGLSGPKGAQGPPGERGLKGASGSRGRPGKSGTNGTPGLPGINAWKVQYLNGSYSSDLLIPPAITDINAPHILRVLVVEEGKSLNLSCAATGNPLPQVEWRRDDGRTIPMNGMEMSSVNGQYLKFTNITRNQMAAYSCYANNGIAPVANATFLVEVHFAPMISVYRQMIYAEYGHSASLECLVEAFPEAIRYWERAYDGKILEAGEKYRIETYPDEFKTTMRLTITNLRKDDFGYYHCVARNELNATMVNFEIAPQDPNSETPYVGKEIKVYGQRPPESVCPICEQCPDASLYQCKDSIMNNFEIQPTGNFSYPGLPKRQKTCRLYAVGKPVFHKAVNEIYGCWLKDPAAKEIDRERTFVTNENDAHNLFEFSTKTQYRMNSVPRGKYEITEGFQGNAHVVYNGSFYYHQQKSDLVVKLDLSTLKKISTQLPYAGIAAGNKLYATDYNYMDFNVDEVGLWVIYSTYGSNNTLVAKLDAENLKVQYNFNITLDHRKFGEMFIVCGNLYVIDSGTEKNSQIRYYVDLYNGKLHSTSLPFSNPFRKTTTVGYNPQAVELYSWDKGNALTYPIRYNEELLSVDHI